MPAFMKFDGVDGEFNEADTFDFSQPTTEPKEPLDSSASGHTGGANFCMGDGSVRSDDDRPTEEITFVYGKLGDDGDVLVGAGPDAPRGHVKVFTYDDGLLLPAVQKVGAARDWPSSNDTHQDDGLLLPAVQTDFGLLLPY